MENKLGNAQSDPQIPSTKAETNDPPRNGDSIIIYGNVGVGASVGRGFVNAEQIAGNDLIVNGTMIDNQGQFSDLLDQLKEMMTKAKELGELPEQIAHDVIQEIDSAQDLIKDEKKPPKETLIQKLQHIVDMIDNVLESANESRSPVAILIKALPFAAVLLRIASQLF
jgi:hypothetical protein